jgi:amidase
MHADGLSYRLIARNVGLSKNTVMDIPAPLQGPAVAKQIRVAVIRNSLGKGIDPHVRAGVDRGAGWLAEAGYEIIDVEPPQVAEVTGAWFDVIGADLGGAWPLMQQTAAPAAVEVVRRFLAAGVLKFVDPRSGGGVDGSASPRSQFIQDHPIVLAPVCCERS